MCDAELGDGRCRVDLDAGNFHASVSVVDAPDARTIDVAGAEAFEDGWFDDGTATWSTGALAGRKAAIETHRGLNGAARLRMTTDFVLTPAAGDALEIVAGCDKRIETCRVKFANVNNFRGFPFIPGDSVVAAYPVEGGVYDGGSLG